MVVVPAVIPYTVPVASIVAFAVLLLLQVPPVVPPVPPLAVSLSAVVLPAHTDIAPVIVSGSAFTVIALVTRQPLARLYVMVPVPVVKPVT